MGAVPALIGSDHEGAGGLTGTAPAGSHAPAPPGAGADGPGAAAGGAGAAGGAALPGWPDPHFQQATAAFFEPQLSQVHSSMREFSPAGRRPARPRPGPRAAQGYSTLWGLGERYTASLSRAYSIESASAAQEASMMFGEQPTVLQRRPSRMSPDSMSTRVTAWVPAASSRMRTL